MQDRVALIELLRMYCEAFPAERKLIHGFEQFLERTAGDQIFTRKNFDGHITTSAFIIDVEKSELLLLRHKSLGRWLQPGGHTEDDHSLVLSALREAVEETGIPEAELKYMPISEGSEMPFDIDSHWIPPNIKKEEAGHFHHDLRYLFAYTGFRDNAFNEAESTGMQWVNFSQLKDDDTFGRVVAKLGAVLYA